MSKFFVNEPLDMGGKPTIEKNGKIVNIRDVVKEVNELLEQREKFREYMLGLELYYMDESLKTDKPFLEEQEKRISLLCSHILQEHEEPV